MKKKFSLKGETLTSLDTDELAGVVAGTFTFTCQFTAGQSCGGVCSGYCETYTCPATAILTELPGTRG